MLSDANFIEFQWLCLDLWHPWIFLITRYFHGCCLWAWEVPLIPLLRLSRYSNFKLYLLIQPKLNPSQTKGSLIFRALNCKCCTAYYWRRFLVEIVLTSLCKTCELKNFKRKLMTIEEISVKIRTKDVVIFFNSSSHRTCWIRPKFWMLRAAACWGVQQLMFTSKWTAQKTATKNVAFPVRWSSHKARWWKNNLSAKTTFPSSCRQHRNLT